jgi:hypothetical protein
VKLNLGCGEFTLPGYCNIDLQPPADVVADFRELSFSDVEEVEMSHVLEHLSWQDTNAVLHQVRLWMRAGGTLRVEVPDMGMILARGVWDKDAEIAVYGIQSGEGEYHKSGFNAEKLRVCLEHTAWRVDQVRSFASTHPARPGFPCLEARAVAA